MHHDSQRTSTRRWLVAAYVLASLASVAGCGGGSGGGDDGDSNPPPTEPSVQQRQQAAIETVQHNVACTSITPFYWEIGDQNNSLASGSGGDGSAAAPTASTLMSIASASKWLFGAYVLEKQAVTPEHPLSADELTYLNFTSAYHSLSSGSCTLSHSVGDCFTAAHIGGHNDDATAADIGHFFYNGGHFQAYATNSLGLGNTFDNATTEQPKLAAEMQSQLGLDISVFYSDPQLAGGAVMTAENYSRFLRKILSGQLRMHDYLGRNSVCTHTNSSDCPSALYSPVNQSEPGLGENDISDEAWHYSLGHWVEDDPTVGDGAFSSAGAFGFYPWIDASKTWYGVIARRDSSQVGGSDPSGRAYFTSVQCGRLLRKAWLSGSAQ
ncbi:hypothetical protein HPT27_04690 [Permianibacter sp. IMCC34836]|uniref:hypothetical protein n=1 Tax=Permianibacter fluminis TaxID=2738515 RepID=UPI001556ED98|nr:hypothetical protein [Permianibacter fluminis]NQD36313.1 hypothetical protein [Permianibacter fluminis]